MSRVYSLNPPGDIIRTGRWVRKSRGSQSWPPIWLAYSVALLEREGHECKLVDASVNGITPMEVTSDIKKFNPDTIAYYWAYDTAENDLQFANELSKKYPLVLVGPWSHCLPDALSRVENVKLMTYGEFEHTLLEIAEGVSPEYVKGLIWKSPDGTITRNDRRQLCSSEELDRIPFVTDVYKRFLDLYKYRQTSFRYPFIDLLTARGCPCHCTFCLWIRAFQGGPSYRSRSIENVIEELWYIKNNLPEIKQIHFQDDTLPPKRARELSQAILDEDLRITWGGYSRAELDRETLELMKQSGLRTLHVGYETCDVETLELIQKDITVETMEEFAKHIRGLGIWTCAGFMIFPWQTKEKVRETIQWAKKVIKPRRFSFTQLFPYPGTSICKTIEEIPSLLTQEEMVQLEKEGFTELYLKNPSWWWDTVKHPSEWENVLTDASGLLEFLRRG